MTMKMHLFASAALLTLITAPAVAADLSEAPPMRVVQAPIEVGGGWYLRGDVGVGASDFGDLSDVNGIFAATTASVPYKSHASQTIVGAGLGYQFNEYFRADLTAEYRGAADFSFGYQNNVTCGGCTTQYNNHFSGKRSSVVGLVNAYVDLGTFSGLTPFVGAGIGFAHHNVSGFNDVGYGGSAGGYGYAKEASSSNFAWALHAGMAYQVSQTLKLELSYRYLNMGNVGLGTVICQSATGPSCAGNTYRMDQVASHDFRLGMRWALGGGMASEPVLMRRN